MSTPNLQTKFRGALLGVAVGDALGAPFEGARTAPPERLERLQQEPGNLRYTDDTHMTLGMAQSLVERGGFDGEHMAATFARNFAAEPWRGYGAGPPRVFSLLERGVSWEEAGYHLFGGSGSFGNGAAMRVAPVGLFAFDDLARVSTLARRTAVITHAHELGQQGAVLQASAVALLLQHSASNALDIPTFLDALRGQLGGSGYRHKLDRIQALLPGGDRDTVIQEIGTGIAAIEAVPTALVAFLRSPRSFVETITYAISLGGDTDTIASMAGALAGAYLGEKSIPATWSNHVEDSGRLRELADALLDLSSANS